MFVKITGVILCLLAYIISFYFIILSAAILGVEESNK